MNSVVVLVFLACLFSASSASFVATTVPFGGITPTLTLSTGQIVNGISDLISFSFWVSAEGGPGGVTATAAIASWTGTTIGTVIASTSVVLPTTAGYSQVLVSLPLTGLDPIVNYVIYITTPIRTPSALTTYNFLTAFSSGTVGGLAQATGNAWSTGTNKDVVFALSFNSVLSVPSTNYAQGPGTGSGQYSWYCSFETHYTSIQVNWQNLLVNTAYFGGVSSQTILAGASFCVAGLHAPFGTTADCWDLTHLGGNNGKIDLTGTQYAVADTFAEPGYLASGSAVFSQNNQVVDLQSSGDCGWTATVAANNAGQVAALGGGWYLQLARLP